MAKVILICGKICSGKSTYAEQMGVQNHAALLAAQKDLPFLKTMVECQTDLCRLPLL